jgi:hypothetical protein
MTPPDRSDRFRISARGPQAWEYADVEVRGGRATITVDDDEDRALELTRIQSWELAHWLLNQLDAPGASSVRLWRKA